LDKLFETPKVVNHVSLEGMDIQIPPRGERPVISRPVQPGTHDGSNNGANAGVIIEATGGSTESLASLGEGHIAYVKQIRSEDVPGLFPQAPKIAPGLKLFALHAADGTPIMLTDSREAAIANAWSNELQAVSVH
jgi:hypothetical protein